MAIKRGKATAKSPFPATMINRLTPQERWLVIGLMLVLATGVIVRYFFRGASFEKNQPTPPAVDKIR